MGRMATSNLPEALDLHRLVQDNADYLFNYALRHFPEEDTARELVQETLLAAVESAARFKGESSPRTWLTSILRFKIIDTIRRRTRENPVKIIEERDEDMNRYFDDVEHWRSDVGPLPWTSDPEAGLSQKQFAMTLEDCLEKLPQRHRQVFLLREIDDLGAEEICNNLGLSATNLRVLLFRCRVHLRDCLNGQWFGKK